MIKSGLKKIYPHRKDLSLIHTFKNHPTYGGVISDPTTLPDNFSIFDGRSIPDQNNFDTRFNPPLPPMPEGCTGEAGAFETGLQDNKLYNPKDLYDNTPPYDSGGRDIRDMLGVLISRGVKDADGVLSTKRLAYFNCYGSGAIDDFDAARIGLWINQNEKRGVYIGSWWYPEFERPNPDGTLPLPSFKTSDASLHNHLATGWRVNNGVVEIQDISWQGNDYANAGVDWITREIYNALMAQPYTGAFTITKQPGNSPIPVGLQAYTDHIVYVLNQFIKNLFKTNSST